MTPTKEILNQTARIDQTTPNRVPETKDQAFPTKSHGEIKLEREQSKP
jgi:hypothetical protein